MDFPRFVGKLNHWLIEHPAKKSRACRVIRLYLNHGNEKKPGDAVGTYPIEKKEDVPGLALRIQEDAQHHADGTGDLTKFVVLAYYSSKDEKKTSIAPEGGPFTFYIDPDKPEDAEMANGVQPTVKGAFALALHHAQIMTKLSHSSTSETIRIMRDLIGLLMGQLLKYAKQIDEMYGERVELISEFEKTLSQQADRDIKRAEAYNSMESKKAIMKTIMMLAPVVVNKLAGKKLLPEGVNSRLEQLKQIVANVSDEQKNKMIEFFMTNFSQEQVAVIGDFYNEVSKEVNKEEDAEIEKEIKTVDKLGIGYEAR